MRILLLLLALLVVACAPVTPSVTPVAVTATATLTPTQTPMPQATPTPLVCPSVALAVSVYELLPSGYGGPPIAGAVLTFLPIYEGDAVSLVTGESGHAVTRIAPGTWELISYVLPTGFVPMQRTDGYGWPDVVYASPGSDNVLVFFVHRIAPTVTPTVPGATPTPQIVACPNYSVNCLPACGANQQVNPYGRCGTGLVCCQPMATRTATP